MGDEPGDADADRTTADWSFVSVNPAQSAARYQRPEQPLRGVQRSVWFPLIIGVVVWQWTGLAFGPLRAAAGGWTWIIGFYMTAYSVLPAQICLLNLGLMFGPGPVQQRVFVYWTTSIALVASWYFWLALANWEPGNFPDIDIDLAQMGVWLPLFVLTLQLPSLALLFWRWRFVNSKVVEELAVRRGSFSIRDLMIATAMVAVTLVWYRWLWQMCGGRAMSIEGKGWLVVWWNTLGIAVAMAPLTWAWLAIRDFSYVLGWCLSAVYTCCAVAIGCLIYHRVDKMSLGIDVLAIVAAMTLGFSLPMIVGLHLLRAFGWRLERRVLRKPEP